MADFDTWIIRGYVAIIVAAVVLVVGMLVLFSLGVPPPFLEWFVQHSREWVTA